HVLANLRVRLALPLMIFLTGNTRDFGQTQGSAPTGLSRNLMFVHLRADLWIWSDTGVRATTGVRADTGMPLQDSWIMGFLVHQTIQGSLSLISAVSGDSAGFENPGWFGSRPHFAGLF
ncbi:MAG: hypothetical protein QGH50_16210, partial [SAR324 cluster bacterium]|nr:hypothetical protein [SAR324 cluster bacterium]